MSSPEEEGTQPESRSPKMAPRTPSTLLDSSSSSSSSSSSVDHGKLTTSQRVCQLLLERHGSRITQFLLQNKEGRQLLKSFIALAFGHSEQEGGNCLVRIIQRDPETLLPLLLKKSADKTVARGLAACFVRGVSNAAAEDLKPVVAALAETITEPLGAQTETPKEDGGQAPAAAVAAAAAAADDDDEGSSDKRPDNEQSAAEGLLRRPSRVQELIREQQRRCQQQQQQLLRQRSSCVRESAEVPHVSEEKDEGRRVQEKLLIEAVIFAATEAASPEAEALCEQLVNLSPAVLTRVIKIEVARNPAETNAAPAAAASPTAATGAAAAAEDS